MTIDLRLFDAAQSAEAPAAAADPDPAANNEQTAAENEPEEAVGAVAGNPKEKAENPHAETKNPPQSPDGQSPDGQSPEQAFRTRLRELRAQRVMLEQKILGIAAERYGVPRGDIAALERAVSEDLQYRRQNADMAARLAVWRAQSAQVSELYPDFDLNGSLADRRFFSLVYRGIDLQTAYEITHRDEIISAAMAYAVKEMKRRGALNEAAASDRPREGALVSGSAVPDSGAKTLSRKQRGELIRRAERGERVTL